MAAEKLSVVLELVSGQYKREAKEAADATGKIGNSAKGVTGTLGAMIGPAAIGGAILGFGKMALAAGENADRLFDLQAQTGVSTDKLQEYEFVAKAAGASTEFFTDAVKQTVKSMDGAIAGTGAASKAYDKLGISVTDANGEIRAAGDITEEAIERLAGMTNITERNALAQDLFGKKWEETVSVLDMGSEAIANLREEGKKGVVSAEALRNSDKFRQTWQTFMATIGPKLNEVLGKIAPALTEVAEGAMDALDAMEPLIDALGWVADKFGDMNVAIEEGKDSPSKWAQSWAIASDVGKGAIFGVVGMIGALMDEENVLKDNTAEATGEISDSWARLGSDFKGPAESIIGLIDRQTGAHRNAAAEANNHRLALINLKNFQAAALDPIANYIELLKQDKEATEALTTAQGDASTTIEDLAIAVIEAEQAELRLEAAGAGLSSENISDFANILITDFGYSEEAALELLGQLNLLDGWEGEGHYRLTMEEVVSRATNSWGSGRLGGNPNTSRPTGFAAGGIVPGFAGEPQLILAHGGERVIPLGQSTSVTHGPTIIVQSPMRDFRSDLQYATTIASVKNLVEAF